MSIRKRGGVYHYQFQINNQTHYGTFLDAKSDAEARKLEKDEKAKVRLGLKQDKLIDGDFCSFVNDVYLPYARENKKSYVHDEFRCKVLTDYFAGKRFSGITMLDVVRFIKHRLSTKICRHNQKSAPTKLRSPVTVHKEVGYCLRSSTWPSFKRLRLKIRAGIFQKRCGRKFPCGKSGSVL